MSFNAEKIDIPGKFVFGLNDESRLEIDLSNNARWLLALDLNMVFYKVLRVRLEDFLLFHLKGSRYGAAALG